MRFYPGRDTEFQLEQLLNEGLTLNENMRGALIETTLVEGENTVRHALGLRPIGYIVIYKDLEGDVYGARIDEWTTETLFLVSSVESQRVRLFVL